MDWGWPLQIPAQAPAFFPHRKSLDFLEAHDTGRPIQLPPPVKVKNRKHPAMERAKDAFS